MEINKRDPPQQLNHSFHSHTLTLYQEDMYDYCASCHKYFDDVAHYYCSECSFYLDVKCALMEAIRCEGQEHIEHFSHQHPMPVVEIDPQHHIQCFACQSLCSGPAYACRACQYFLHKSCGHLPLLIQHPAHSFHPLFLRVKHSSFTCNICGKEKENTFIYACKQCSNKLRMCVKCYHENLLCFIGPSIKYRYHEHLFFFHEDGNYRDLAQCNASDNYCHQPKASTDLHYTTNSCFHCAKCDFKIHFLCGPLPSTIKHECHMHSLDLIDSVVEAYSDEYYCDVCEIERNPRIRVYYCKECQYIAHPHCVISEIVKVFNGDLGGVKLKLIGQDFWEQPHEEDWDMSSSFTLYDLLSSDKLSDYEKGTLRAYFQWDKSSKGEEDSKVEPADEDIDEIITRYPFFNQQEDLTSFFFDDFLRFSRKEKLVVKSTDLSLKIVGVQGYSIPVTLAPVLQALLHKYGDISPPYSWVTPSMKSICFFFLCKVINSMHTTRFADITKNLLRDWYYYLQFLRNQGFRIDFVKRHLEMMTNAFVGVQLARLETEIPTKLNKKIGKLRQEIADLEAKEDICKKRLESSSNPEFIKDRLRQGAELKWKTAGQVWF